MAAWETHYDRAWLFLEVADQLSKANLFGIASGLYARARVENDSARIALQREVK